MQCNRWIQRIPTSGSQSTDALVEELLDFCRSESLSEDGLREIIERYGCERNSNLHGDNCLFFLELCHNKLVTEGILRYLLEYFPNAVNATTSEGVTPLCMIWGMTPLHMICCNKNATRGMVQFLIDACPKCLGRANINGWMPLHTLCNNKELDDSVAVDILGLLLERCPEAVRHVDGNGALPIHVACAVGLKSVEFCRMLIEAYPGSERIATSEDTLLPLHIACKCGAVATAAYLYELYPESINVAAGNGLYTIYTFSMQIMRGYYPIHCAIARLKSETPTIAVEMVHMLLDCDPSVVVSQEFHGVSPLFLVCIMGSSGVYPAFSFSVNVAPVSDVLKVLHLLYDAQPEAIEENMIDAPLDMFPEEIQSFVNSQLTYARQSRDLTFMSTRNENGQLPLHTALRDNAPFGSIKLLVKGNPIAVQTADNDGALPLHLATQHHDSTKVVDYLIGLDPTTLTTVDGNGNTALHYACRGAKHEIIALLLEEYDAVAVSKRNALNKLPIHILLESGSVSDGEEDAKYAESIFQLLRAYPETVVISDTQ